MRILYNNIVDLTTTTLTGSSSASGGTGASNMKLDTKGKVWRSGTTTHAIILATFTSTIPAAVVLPLCNLTSTATIQVIGYTSTPSLGGTTGSPTITGGTPVFDTGVIDACPYIPAGYWDWTSTTNVNTYAYGGGNCARVYIPDNIRASCTSMTIDIIDSSNTYNYIEASRLLIGPIWEPKYNTSFGISTGTEDLSSHKRTVSGDLVTMVAPRFDSLTFDLKYMDIDDRVQATRILKGNGKPRPLFVSLFPEDPNPEKEQGHQLYGKLADSFSVSHPIFEMYSTQIKMEGV